MYKLELKSQEQQNSQVVEPGEHGKDRQPQSATRTDQAIDQKTKIPIQGITGAKFLYRVSLLQSKILFDVFV